MYSSFMGRSCQLHNRDNLLRAGETAGMEAYQQAQDRQEALQEGGMPTIALPHMPPPLCTGLMPGNDSEHNGQLFSPGALTQVVCLYRLQISGRSSVRSKARKGSSACAYHSHLTLLLTLENYI